MERQHQVAIVGGGPVGLALAVELGQRDIDCVLVERHRAPVRIPKGQNLTGRTLEHFYFWRCVDEIRASRVLPPGYPIGGVTAYGNLMSPYFYWAHTGGRGPRDQDYFFQRNERLPQYATESVLRARLRDLPSVTTHFGWTAERVEQDDDGTRISIVPSDESAFYSWSADAQQVSPQASDARADRRVLRAEFLVGCDGGRSLVRESMGIERSGRDFDQRMVLAVLRSRELHEALKRYPESTTYRVLKPELQGYWQFFGRIDVGEGFFFHAPVPKDTRPDNFDFLGLLHEAAGFAFAAELDHVGFWDLRVMTASRYRQGRVFIAGDACHQHPPYGGFGLNTGLEDAANLGWKLAATIQGWGGQDLLDSYAQERQPIFRETGEVMIAGGIGRDRAFLERYNPEKDGQEFEQAWAEFGRRARSARQAYEPHYEGSPVVAGPPNGVCSIHGEPSLAAQAGHHLAPRLLSNDRNVFQMLGQGFTLLAFGAEEAAVRRIDEAARSLRVPLVVVRDSFDAERAAYAARLVLVRPDQYVVWAGDGAPADPMTLLRTVTGQELRYGAGRGLPNG
ncbi:MAG TPA: FAD-dependent monooxygenase [Chloroflexota bacterium]|nr:FAD-dependent monooxygenase [Chloroflexota bacterium]